MTPGSQRDWSDGPSPPGWEGCPVSSYSTSSASSSSVSSPYVSPSLERGNFARANESVWERLNGALPVKRNWSLPDSECLGV